MKSITRALSLLAFALYFQELAWSQSITLTSPAANATYSDGEDYATRVLRNPWDMNERLDIGWEENFVGTSVGVSGGIWSGTNEIQGAYLFPLFPDFKGTVHAEPLPGDRSMPKLGISHPINADKYSQLCYKTRSSSRSTYAIYWENNPNKSAYWPDGTNRGVSYDGYYPHPWRLGIANSGWHIYCFDMKAQAFEQNSGSWAGDIHALRLDLSIAAPPGATNEVDWVRLFDPSTSPTLTINWSTSGLGSAQMRSLMVDTDNSGRDGVTIARFIDGVDPGTYTFRTAMLPPGDYYFYVQAQEAGPGQLTGPITYSNYSGRVRINASPIGYVTSPSQVSGKEFAAEELGNAWDMDSSAADVANLDRTNYPDVLRQFSSEGFVASPDAQDSGTLFQAQANPALPGFNEGDNQVHLKIPAGKPIDAGKYRYLVYRMAADATNFPTVEKRVREGWVTRFIWWNNDVIGDGGDPGGHVLHTGWHVYANDLWNQNLERGIPWTSNSFIKNLRIDPLETNLLTWFYIDWVRLYAENRALDDSFTISWNISDEDNSSFDVSLYYDTNDTGFDGTLITTLSGVTAGDNSYVWNTSGLTSGQKYWVYLRVTDGTNTASYYSPVHVVMGEYVPSPVPRTGRAEFDYDGDAKSDLALLRPAFTTKVKRKTVRTPTRSSVLFTANGVTANNVHSSADARLIGADVNGDKYTDLITVQNNPANGFLSWTGTQSRTGLTFSSGLGLIGDQPLKGDFNGNHVDEIAIYRNGFWYVQNESGALSLVIWGMSGDQPVPADYDGDGTTDYAIWRPSTGEWITINSGYAAGFATEQVTVKQWGLNGDTPVPADYDGDGRDDFVIFRPTDGNWYIRYAKDDSFAAVSWGHGYFGDIPFKGMDMNGDARADIVVYRPSVGHWYINYNNGGGWAFREFGTSFHSLPLNHK